MNRLIFSAYQKPKRLIFINAELMATILSIVSYSLIVFKQHFFGFLLGLIASILLVNIMQKKNSTYLVYLYTFFVIANFVGLITS